MDSKIKVSLGVTALLIAVVGIRVGMIYHQRNTVNKPAEEKFVPTPQDDMVTLKHEFPSSLKDEKDLAGKPIWVAAGGQLDYYPYAAHHADYHHPAGTLLGAERLDIKDAFEQVAPSSAAVRIPQGDAQVLLVFTKPGDTKQYAVPVGDREGKAYHLLTDDLYFYDDPHQVYGHWDQKTWDAIDHHQVIQGMSERQAMLALGQVSQPSSDNFGDRTVRYYNLGHPVTMRFEHDKAVSITQEPAEKK